MSFARSISLAVVFLAGVVRGEITCSDRDRDGELEGVVSFYCHTEPYFFMLDEADKSWRVEFADVKEAPPLVPGCRVKVRGVFPKWATTPRMRGASVAVTGKASVPPYIELTPEEMYATDADGEPGRRSWYGRLVSTSGVIRDINRRETYTQLVIGPKETPVLVSVPFKLTDPLPPEIEIGASVRVRGVGVYAADRDGKRNVVIGVKDIQVRVEDIDDVSLLTPKQFWTAGKVGAVICILVAILFLAVGLVHRARMRDRIAADAVRRERLRLTSELHDNFQQLLAGCMFRLGAAMGKVGKDDAGAAKQLELLRDSLNHTQASLRAALWGLTEEAEGPAALTELFKYAASRMPQWEGVVRFTLRGREREVARQCSGALLLILQEAVGNALRHGHARHVDVVVDFTDGVLKFGAIKTSSRTTTNYAWRFNNSGTNILEVGHLGKSDDRISIRVGEGSSSSGHLKIRKVGTGTLELWNPGHRYGTEIDNGTVLVTSDKALNLYANGDITFGHDASAPGGILKYGVNQWADDGSELETPVDVTTDYSALIKNSFAPVAIDTDGKDVTFATALSSSNVGGISKYGEGTLTLSAWQTLLAPVAVSNGTLHAKVNANVTGRIDIAEGATLTLYGASKNLNDSTVHGSGTIQFVQEDGQTRHFRLGQTADFSDFTGTVEFVVKNAQSAADGLVNASWDNHLEGATLLISGAPASPIRVFDMERNVVVGAYQQTNANLQVQVKQNQTLTFGAKAGAVNILNGPIINSSIRLVKNGATKLTVGPGFSVLDGSTLTVNAGTFELSEGVNYSGISSFTTIANGVTLAGEGVFGAVDLTAHDVVVPDASTFTDKEATYPLLTATSFSGTSANATALLATLNANEKGGKWKLGILRNGNGTSVLCIRYFKGGLTIVIR